MANTLTNLIPSMYAALDQVSRELVGFIPAVTRNSGVERAAKDQNVYVPIAPAVTLGANTPAVTAPDTGDNVMTSATITISKSYHAPIRWNGEETLGLRNAGTYEALNRNRFVQAFRALTNQIETDLGSLYYKASRAAGLAGTAPFATVNDLSDLAAVRRILNENGAPQNDLQLVLGHSAIQNLQGKQSFLFHANEAAGTEMLREGRLSRLEGFDVHHSGQIAVHTIGTSADDYDVDLVAGYLPGDTTIHVDTGTGTHTQGDVVYFVGDSNGYVINTAAAGNGDKDLVINAPGLQLALADGVGLDIADDAATWKANMAFSRSAIVLATRLPALPDGGDSADDRMTIVDPNTGLAFEVAIYRQYRQVHVQIGLAWGYELIKPAHAAILMG